MSAIVAAMVAAREEYDRTRNPEDAILLAWDLDDACKAIAAVSNAAGAGRVVEGAPRTWAVRWLSRSGSAIAIVDGADATCFRIDERETHDYRRRLAFRLRPTWDAANRLWVWGIAAHDPRPCAWPRPFARSTP